MRLKLFSFIASYQELRREVKKKEETIKTLTDAIMRQPHVINSTLYMPKGDGTYDVYKRLGRTRTPMG